MQDKKKIESTRLVRLEDELLGLEQEQEKIKQRAFPSFVCAYL